MGEFKVGDWVSSECFTGRITKTIGTEHKVQTPEDECWLSDRELLHVKPLKLRYINYKGEQSRRKVIPLGTHFKASPYHNEGKPTWIMEAFDLDKEAMRDFCMSDILEIG